MPAAVNTCLLIAGRSGTGKTTFALRYLVNRQDLLCRFIFDPRGEYSERLNLPAAQNEAELEDSLADGWALFDPSMLFPGQHPEALAWFSRWAYSASLRAPGPKVFLVDEVWKYCTPTSIPAELATCIQEGRHAGLATVFCTQRPNRVNESITNEVTELVCFRLQGQNALKRVVEMDVDLDAAKSLERGQYLYVNLDTGEQRTGRVF